MGSGASEWTSQSLRHESWEPPGPRAPPLLLESSSEPVRQLPASASTGRRRPPGQALARGGGALCQGCPTPGWLR